MGERQAYWTDPGGLLEEIKEIDYTGDSANNREILLGGTFNDVEVYPMDTLGAADHLALARSFMAPGGTEVRTVTKFESGACTHASGSAAGAWWQGFEGGRDRVRLGATGSAIYGTNRAAYSYKIIARRYRTIAA